MKLCPVPEDYDIRKRVLFENAKRLFAKYGTKEVSIADIAKGYSGKEQQVHIEGGRRISLSVAKSLLTKEKLLADITNATWSTILAAMGEIFKRNEDDPLAALHELINKIPKLLAEDLEACGILIRERYPNAKIGKHIEGSTPALRCIKTVANLITAIQEKGKLKQDVGDCYSIAHCLYGALEHGMLDAYLHSFPHENESNIEALLRVNKRVDNLIQTLRAMLGGVIKA